MKYVLIAWIVGTLNGHIAVSTFQPLIFETLQQCNAVKTAMLRYNTSPQQRFVELTADCVAR